MEICHVQYLWFVKFSPTGGNASSTENTSWHNQRSVMRTHSYIMIKNCIYKFNLLYIYFIDLISHILIPWNVYQRVFSPLWRLYKIGIVSELNLLKNYMILYFIILILIYKSRFYTKLCFVYFGTILQMTSY